MLAHNPDLYNVSLKILLKNSKGEVLALKAPESSTMAGYYDLPGGRINEDEFTTDYAELMKRELGEEIGDDVKCILNLKPVSFGRHSYYSNKQQKEIRIIYLCFEAEYISGEIKISKEHAGFAWLDFKNIKPEDYFTKGPLEAVKRYIELKNMSSI